MMRAAGPGGRAPPKMARRSRTFLRYFSGSLVFTAVGLALGAALGLQQHGTLAGAAGTAFIVGVLGVLEVSLSFDNAVVNATVLEGMTPVWRRRFLTWGIAIAVFGMRLVFPLLVVSSVAWIGPLEALRLAALRPAEYARILTSAHVQLGAFGGAFLGTVSLEYFLDAEKDVHWVRALESRLARLGRIESVELGLVLLAVWACSHGVPVEQRAGFLAAGLFGVVAYIVVDGLGSAMQLGDGARHDLHRASAASFLYLEVLDASFSFDGVIGAFALTNNLFVIAIGLGIGAMFVRSLTVLLVDRGTLASYRFLEHGAFYAIGALAALMLAGTIVEVPEVVTGLVGAGFIGLSIWSSVRHATREAGSA
jgi:hypothetical protein